MMNKRTFPDTYVAVDLETTGLRPDRDRILEIGACKVIHGQVTERFSSFVDPQIGIPQKIQDLTGITPDMVAGERTIEQVLPEFIEFCQDMDLLGHNILFDYSFLKNQAFQRDITFEKQGIDTLKIARGMLPQLESRCLGSLCEYFSIELTHAHRAFDDALAAHHLFEKLKENVAEEYLKLFTFQQLMYKPKKQSPITVSQKAYLNDLMKYHRIDMDIEIGSLTKSEASRKIDQIISEYGRIMR